MSEQNNLIDYLNTNYQNLGIYKIKKIKHTDINSINFLVESKSGNYVLHSYDSLNAKRTEKICRILYRCKQNNANVSEPILNNKNRFIDTRRKLYLTKFYDGNFFSNSSGQLCDLAKNIAQLHKVLKTIKANITADNNQKYYKLLSNKEFEAITRLANKKLYSYDKLISKNIRLLNSVTEYLKNTDHVRKYSQLIHSDLHPKNVLFNNSKLAVILDFGAMRKGSPIEDIAFTSFRFSLFANQQNTDIKNTMKKFLKIYLSFNKLKIEFEDEEYFLKKMILQRINYIVRNRYFDNSNLWISDTQKHLSSLKLADSIFK
ncbi:MAG: hypothetical protein EB158_06660 [Nitrosopumilaceae archaeon]|nr:hypothetical protein [Nitrosopumilaceae archaeon]